MHNLMRFWYQNKNQIIKVGAIVIFVFLIIQVVNLFVKRNNEKKFENVMNGTNINANNTSSTENNTVISDKSAITGQNVSSKQLSTDTNTINNFINYCNQKDLEKAYSMLTEDCKSQIYTTLDTFTKAYYNDVFNGQKKTCTIENWFGNTYKVNIYDDMLATGKETKYSKQDYITIETENGENKLNINNYIGHKDINKTTTNDNITVQVESRDTYKDYEEYTIKVKNDKDKTIQLDTIQSPKTLYLEDEKGVKYNYYSNELTDSMLTIEAGHSKEMTIKFYSTYISSKKIRNIVFSNLKVIDGEKVETLEFSADV
mgnify:FL=1